MHSDGSMRTNVNIQAQLQTLLESRFGTSRANQILGQLGVRRPGARPSCRPTFTSLLQFYLRSGMTADQFAQIYNDVTVEHAQFKQGRVNINTASATVLALSARPG